MIIQLAVMGFSDAGKEAEGATFGRGTPDSPGD